MGRWDDGSGQFAGAGGGTGRTRKNYARIAKFVILGGFIVVGIIVLSVFITRSGLNIEIREQNEAMGTIQTISVRISNNKFDTLNDVTVQFGDNGKIRNVGTIGPFSSIMITPDPIDLNFDKVIVKGNGGKAEAVKFK
jgi:hypothetical protein